MTKLWTSQRTLLAVIGVVLFSLVALGGCSKSAAKTTPAVALAPMELTVADNNTSVQVAPGQNIRITLDANPSTGYTWAVVSAPPFLKATGEPTFAFEGDVAGGVGAGGKQTLEIATNGTGTGTLDLGYLRTFEKGVPPVQTFKLEVTSK